MIAPTIVAEIRRLLAERTRSHREIARLTGVSRGTIGAIASGRRIDRDPLDDEPETPAGPPVRCPGCGGLVYMPCILCRAREERDKKRHAAPARPAAHSGAAVVAPAGLDLRPEHFARYLQVCDWRLKNLGPFRGSAT